MLRVVCEKPGGIYKNISLYGHCDFANSGKDIVCAAVSILYINTINSIEKFTDDVIITQEMGKGDKQVISAYFKDKPGEKSVLLMDSMMLGLKEIQKSYKKNISVEIKEE